MNRLYAVESTPTLTGAKADHRLPLRAVGDRGVRAGAGGTLASAAAADRSLRMPTAEVAHSRRQGSAGASRPLAGRRRATTSRRRSTRWRTRSIRRWATSARRSPHAAVEVNSDRPARVDSRPRRRMDAGQVELLVILGANPVVHRAGRSASSQERLAKVPLVASHLGLTTTRRRGSATGTCRRRIRSRAGATRAPTTAP